MRKRRKFADGGITDNAQQPTYPFYGNQPQGGSLSGGVNQTFNVQPQATAGMPEQQFKKGGQAKVGKVMSEFKSGKLKSSSGQKVTNPKQAIAIGLSEAGLSKKAKGGIMKESKQMMKKEISFMKKKGAPKSMIKHEMAEAGMKRGGNVKKMAVGGTASPAIKRPMETSRPVGVTTIGRSGTGTTMPKGPYATGGPGRPTGGPTRPLPPGAPKVMDFGYVPPGLKKMASGGLAAGHKSADGVARKGKTDTKHVKMAKGGMTKKAYGGKC